MPEHPLEPIVATIEAFQWLAGGWQGGKGPDFIEEQWSRPAAGAMMGMFRWLRNREVWFYELMTLEPEGEGLTLRIKHFYPGLKGWEEKDDSVAFDLVSLDGSGAIFSRRGAAEPLWMIYRRVSDNEITAYFEKEDYSPPEEDLFNYRRT